MCQRKQSSLKEASCGQTAYKNISPCSIKCAGALSLNREIFSGSTAEKLKNIKTVAGRFDGLFDIYDLFRDCIMGLSGGCFIA